MGWHHAASVVPSKLGWVQSGPDVCNCTCCWCCSRFLLWFGGYCLLSGIAYYRIRVASVTHERLRLAHWLT